MNKEYVFCISAVGSCFIGELLKVNAPEGIKDYKPSHVKSEDKFAEVLDIEYNQKVYQKWGYDCFHMDDKYWGHRAQNELTRLIEKGIIKIIKPITATKGE